MGQSQWMLVAVEGRFAGKHFPIPERGLAFGRDDDNDLVLEDDNVSRHHAILRVAQNRPVLEDLKSRNGTFVNNQKVSRLELQEGDRIALGTHLFKVMPVTNEKTAVGPGMGTGAPEGDPERTIVYQRSAGRGRSDLAATRAISLNMSDPGGDGMVPAGSLAAGPAPYSRPGTMNLAGDIRTTGGGAGGPVFGSAAAPQAGVAPSTEMIPTSPVNDLASVPVVEPVVPVMGTTLGMSSEMGPAPEPVAPIDYQPRKRSRGGLYAGIAVVVAVAIAIPVWMTSRGGEKTAAPGVSAAGASEMPMVGASTGASIPAPSARRVVVLTPEEEGLPPQEKLARANEHFDQGETFMESDKLKQAREEFERALLLNPDCKVCLIRLSKVESGIKKSLEKYRGDALRSYHAMEYDKAKRYWEMVLELESDPEGQRVAREGIQNARAQLHQQSYR